MAQASKHDCWLVVGVNAYTGKREIICEAATLESALLHKIDLQNQKPLDYVGVCAEYGNREEWRLREPLQALLEETRIYHEFNGSFDEESSDGPSQE